MTDVSLARSSYRLLVVDIDGTLLDKDGNISAEDRGALDMVRESGIMLALSTGRSALACRGVIDSLSLDGYHIFFDGALVGCLESGHEVSAQPISRAICASFATAPGRECLRHAGVTHASAAPWAILYRFPIARDIAWAVMIALVASETPASVSAQAICARRSRSSPLL